MFQRSSKVGIHIEFIQFLIIRQQLKVTELSLAIAHLSKLPWVVTTKYKGVVVTIYFRYL